MPHDLEAIKASNESRQLVTLSAAELTAIAQVMREEGASTLNIVFHPGVHGTPTYTVEPVAVQGNRHYSTDVFVYLHDMTKHLGSGCKYLIEEA